MLCEQGVADVVAMVMRENPTMQRQGLTQNVGYPKALVPCSAVSITNEIYLTHRNGHGTITRVVGIPL